MQLDSGKTTTDDVVKIGDVNVVVQDVGKKPKVFGKSIQTNFQIMLESISLIMHKPSTRK